MYPEFFKSVIKIPPRMDTIHFSFKFSAVPPHNSVKWYACMGNRQKRRQTGMLLLSLAIRKKPKRYPIGKVVRHSSFLTFTTSRQFMELLRSKHKAWVLNTLPNIHLLFTLERFQQNVLQESSETIKRTSYEKPKEFAPHAQQSKQMSAHW